MRSLQWYKRGDAYDSVSADLQFAAVWVTIADLKSAKRTDARRANSLEADCRRTSQGEEW